MMKFSPLKTPTSTSSTSPLSNTLPTNAKVRPRPRREAKFRVVPASSVAKRAAAVHAVDPAVQIGLMCCADGSSSYQGRDLPRLLRAFERMLATRFSGEILSKVGLWCFCRSMSSSSLPNHIPIQFIITQTP